MAIYPSEEELLEDLETDLKEIFHQFAANPKLSVTSYREIRRRRLEKFWLTYCLVRGKRMCGGDSPSLLG